MSLIPEYSINLINGFLLIIPMFLIRFGLAYIINPKSLSKLQYFPEVIGKEKTALKIYFLTNTILIFSPIFNPIKYDGDLSLLGCIIYLAGILFFILSIINFSGDEGFVYKGIYRISRNPMYIGYFGIFLGTSILIDSISHVLITVIYQVTVHYLILSEERWCRQQFNEKYEEYLRKVPRYFLFF